MSLTPEQIQAAAAVAGLLITVLGSALGVWWRVTAKIHAFTEAQTSTLAALDKLRIQVAHSLRKIDQRLGSVDQAASTVSKELATFSVLLSEREKDVARLEGQLDQLGSLVVKQVAAVQGAVASLDAVWRVLQKLHPEAVPKRASERGS